MQNFTKWVLRHIGRIEEIRQIFSLAKFLHPACEASKKSENQKSGNGNTENMTLDLLR